MAEKKTTAKKDAKTEIKKAQVAAKEKSAAKAALVSDVYASEKKAKAKTQKESADEFIKSEFVSETIKQRYQDLEAELASKEEALKNLYGIEAEGAAIADMVNAHNVLQAELAEEAAQAAKDRQIAHDADVASKKAELQELQDLYAKNKKELDASNKEYQKQLAQERTREAEEFKYNLERTRSKENDAWNDEKAAREKALASKEADLGARTNAVTEREKKMTDLEAQVAGIPEAIAKATEEGRAAGKAEADKAHAFEKRYMERDHEAKIGLLENTVKAQETKIEELQKKLEATEAKLDVAYQRNQELSLSVSKNSGSTTYVTQTEAPAGNGKK